MNVIDIMNPPEAIWIGRKGENVFREVPIDCSGYIEKHPNATITAMYQSGENEPFPVVLEQNGNTFTWKPRSEEITDEYGRIEIVLTDGEAVGASKIVECFVDESLIDGSEHPAESAPAWSVEMVQDVTEQADRAEDAVEHYPQIRNGELWVWNITTEKWEKLDVSGGGGSPNAVLYTPQSLTDSQKAQARTNVGAGTYSKPSGGIPASDLASGVIPSVPQMATASDMSDWTSGKAVDAAVLKADFQSALQALENVEDAVDHHASDISILQTDKADKTEIPTKTSDLTNDSGFLTPSQIVTEGDTVIDPTLLIKGAAADALSVREAFVANVQPLFVDVLAGNWLGSQNAAFSNSAENAEKYFTFSGAAGADTVSVTGGTASISSLTQNQWWRAVVQYDDGTCVPTMAAYQGTSDSLRIFPPLTSAVTNGKLMPSVWSIHATSLGYKWYAQYVYGSNAKHCLKSKPIARYRAWNSDAIPFTKINSFWWGENSGNVQRSLQVCNATVKHLHMNIDKSASAETPKGFSWTVNVGGKTGYVEILMSGNYAADFFEFPQGEGFVIELYQDGVLTKTYHKTTVHYERICLDFSDCDTMELRAYATGNSVTHTIELTEVSVWETGAFDRAELLPFGSVPAQLFDSWGVQFDSATAAEFKRLHTLKLGVTAPWENHSLGGATSAWGRAWFYENVVKYHPTHVLLDFIINDSNSRSVSGFAQTVEGPDGVEYDNIMNTVDEYIDNMLAIIKMAMSYGIQPIICMAPYSDNEKPEWSYRLIDKWSVDPERFDFSISRGAESPQSLDLYAKKSWVQNQGYQTAQDVQTAIAGVRQLPTVTASDNGKFLRVVNGAWAAQTVPSAEGASF